MSSAGRPVGNLLFLGPTGSGKTRLVEAVAESLVGDARAVIKIDCAEFQHSHEIAKLIGSPPGYLGHRETHPVLSQEVLNQYHTDKVKLSFVLFDEIEKASDALWNLLLGILDKATLTLGDNRRVDFSQSLIFMTSNLGAAEMNSILRPGLGFASHQAEQQSRRRNRGCRDVREDCRGRHGSGAPQVHAGIHEPHRQDRGVSPAGRGGAAQDPDDRAERRAAAHFQRTQRGPVRVHLHRAGAETSCCSKAPT